MVRIEMEERQVFKGDVHLQFRTPPKVEQCTHANAKLESPVDRLVSFVAEKIVSVLGTR